MAKILLLAFGLFIHQAYTCAQSPNYTGTWVLNFEKSKLEDRPNGLIGSVFVVKQNGDNFRLTRYHVLGDKENKISFKMVADGKTRRVKLLFRGKLEHKDNGLQATLWRKNFLNVVRYKFGDSENEFIADEVFTGKTAHHHNVWVFDRAFSK